MYITNFVATIAEVVNNSHMLVIVISDMLVIERSRMPVDSNSHIPVIVKSYASHSI
jgi:hypothetical protein